MNYCTTLNTQVKYQLATIKDTEAVSQLNKKWLKRGLLNTSKTEGFLFGDPLSHKDIHAIIKNEELVVFYDQDQLAGYYLLDNHSTTTIRSQHAKYINYCIEKGVISPTNRISTRMQCVVDEAYQKQGKSRIMFQELLENAAYKYDLLFATCAKNNPKYTAHLKVGWEIIDETKDLYLLGYWVG